MDVDPLVRQVSKKQHIDCDVVLNEREDDRSEMGNSIVNNEHKEVSLTLI